MGSRKASGHEGRRIRLWFYTYFLRATLSGFPSDHGGKHILLPNSKDSSEYQITQWMGNIPMPSKGGVMVSPEFGVQMSCGHLNTLVFVRCRDLLMGQFVHSRTTGNQGATGASYVSRCGLLRTHPQDVPAAGHPSRRPRVWADPRLCWAYLPSASLFGRHHCSEAAGGGLAWTGTAPPERLLSVQER